MKKWNIFHFLISKSEQIITIGWWLWWLGVYDAPIAICAEDGSCTHISFDRRSSLSYDGQGTWIWCCCWFCCGCCCSSNLYSNCIVLVLLMVMDIWMMVLVISYGCMGICNWCRWWWLWGMTELWSKLEKSKKSQGKVSRKMTFPNDFSWWLFFKFVAFLDKNSHQIFQENVLFFTGKV